MIPKVLFIVCFFVLFTGAVQPAFTQIIETPPGTINVPNRSGLPSNGNLVFNTHSIYRLVLRSSGKFEYEEVFTSKKEIKNAYFEKRIERDLFVTLFIITIQYTSGEYVRVTLRFYADSATDRIVKGIPVTPDNQQPTNIAGDDLYCFINQSVYVLRDSINGPWLINNTGLPNFPTLYDINIDSLQNAWLICNNRLYMQPLVSNTWTLRNNLSGNYRLFIDRFQKIWLGRTGNVAYTIDQGTTMEAGPAGIGSGEAILGLSTDYNGDVYIMTYSFYPLSGGGNKIYRSAGGSANFVRIDQNLAPQFAKYGTNQIYNGIYADSGVYVAHGSGSHFSNDAGTNWQYIPGPPSGSAYSVVPTLDSQLMMTTPAGAYKGNIGNWTKKHPSIGFQNNINLFNDDAGTIYAQAEKLGVNNSGTSPRYVIYKSTDNGNSFAPDSAGLSVADVGMAAFYVDETGVQHAAGVVNAPGFGKKITLWKKAPGQPWMLDMGGFPTIYNQSVQQFTGDGQGNIHCHFINAGFNNVTSTRSVNGTTWSDVPQLGFKLITDQAGRSDGVSVFASVGDGSGGPGELIKKNGNTYTNVPLPNGITAANIVSSKVTFDSSGALWAYFSTYPFFPNPIPPDARESGAGLFYTTDFITWQKPANDVDTTLFRSIRAIGDSVFAIPQNFDGVFVFKKQAAVTVYTFSGNGNWSNAANWSNNTIPPSPLPAGREIIVNPAGTGECNLDIPQTIAPGGKLTIPNSKKFKVNGNLNIQ